MTFNQCQLGPAIYASTDSSGVTVHRADGPASDTAVHLSVAELEELIRVAVRAGLITLGGGER